MAGSGLRFGVAARLQAGLVALALFTIGACVIAVVSFNDLRKSLDRIASTQLDTMVAAAQLRQDSEAITALAASLFAKGLDQSTLLDFSVQIYNRQVELNAQIGALAKFVESGNEIPNIQAASSALFQNIDALSTAIYGKAVAEASMKVTLRQVASLLYEAGHIIRIARRVKPGQILDAPQSNEEAAAEWAREVELINASILSALSTDDPARLAAQKEEVSALLTDAENVLSRYPVVAAGLAGLQAQLDSSLLGDRGVVTLREQLIVLDSQVRQLLAQNEDLSGALIGAVDTLMNRVRDDIATENSLQGSVISARSHILEAVAGLGGFGALAIGLYFQIAVIRRLNRLRNYMHDEKSIPDPESLTRGNDEISEMAQAFVHYSNEIKQREDALRESELRFRHLFESAPISIWAEDWSEVKAAIDELREHGISDLRSYFQQHPEFIQGLRHRIRWIDMNSATLHLYGAESKNELRKHIADIASVEGYPETIIKFSEGAQQFSKEIGDTRIDGSSIRVIETYHMSEEDSSDWSRVVACMLDITDRKRAEEQLQIAKDLAEAALEELKQTQQNLIQSEKMASLGQLTAGIAHEIKNPLNFINNFSDVSVELMSELQGALSSTIGSLDRATSEEIAYLFETVSGNLAKIRGHGQRADRIVRSMLSHAREGSAEPASTDLNSLVEDALNLAYHGARAENPNFNVTLERRYDDSAGVVTMLPQDMTRVLLNLMGNGFYSTQRRKETTSDRAYKPTLLVATRDLGDAVEIRVRDNGIGIPADVVDKIFNPFFTTKPTGEGTGLGLSLSYEIVVGRHNGKLEVATEEDSFAEFTITLPRNQSVASITRGAAK